MTEENIAVNWYFLQETTHDIVMLDHDVLCITQKRNSYVCLNETAEKKCWQNVLY